MHFAFITSYWLQSYRCLCSHITSYISLKTRLKSITGKQRKEIVIKVTSASKEYWVPRVKVSLLVEESKTIKGLIDELCFIFHHSYEMSKYKENYPCHKRSNMLLLYRREDKKRMYRKRRDGTFMKLSNYKIKNGTEFVLNYS